MSYTNIDLVRNFLGAPFPVQSRVNDQAIVLTGDDYVSFHGGMIDNDSIVVKCVRSNNVVRKTITFDDSSIVLSSSPVIPASVLLASDSSLGVVYTEGCDFLVDHSAGRVTIKDGGALSIGATVVAWYVPYHVCPASTDYQVDSSKGTIRRMPSGSIGDGETVYLDYVPVFAGYRDEILMGAVLEANALVEKAVDPERQFGADPVLQGAATYRALEIICRASAAHELSSLSRNDKAALAWMKLGDNYAMRSEQLLSCFRAPFSGPSAPVKS